MPSANGRGRDYLLRRRGRRELAIVEEDPAALQAAYQSILDRYHFTWLDFDIEGSKPREEPRSEPAPQHRFSPPSSPGTPA